VYALFAPTRAGPSPIQPPQRRVLFTLGDLRPCQHHVSTTLHTGVVTSLDRHPVKHDLYESVPIVKDNDTDAPTKDNVFKAGLSI
jgi:hypothetical protein